MLKGSIFNSNDNNVNYLPEDNVLSSVGELKEELMKLSKEELVHKVLHPFG